MEFINNTIHKMVYFCQEAEAKFEAQYPDASYKIKGTVQAFAFASLGVATLSARIYNLAVAKLCDTAATYGPASKKEFFAKLAADHYEYAADNKQVAKHCFIIAKYMFPFFKEATPVSAA